MRRSILDSTQSLFFLFSSIVSCDFVLILDHTPYGHNNCDAGGDDFAHPTSTYGNINNELPSLRQKPAVADWSERPSTKREVGGSTLDVVRAFFDTQHEVP